MISSEYMALLDRMAVMHRSKNAGYAGQDNPDPWANFRQSEKFGVPAHIGCLVRWSDKYTRVINLLRDPTNDQVGEALEDTMFDLAAYSLIFICLYREYCGRESSTDDSREPRQDRLPTPPTSFTV
jgi:hypothetical protein